MNKASWKKLACVGMIAFAAVITGCGSEHKVAVIDYQKLEDSSPKIKAIQQEITDKDKEINDRLTEDSKKGLSDEDMQKKVQSGTDDFHPEQAEADRIHDPVPGRSHCQGKEHRNRDEQNGSSNRRH